jgi:hypothetical protein
LLQSGWGKSGKKLSGAVSQSEFKKFRHHVRANWSARFKRIAPGAVPRQRKWRWSQKMPRTPYWTAGNVVEIKLPEGWAYGKVVVFPLMAFYAVRPKRVAKVNELQGERFTFRVWVMKYAIGKKGWPLIGGLPLSEDESVEPWFFKKDPISGRITRYLGSTSEEVLTTVAECSGLECAAVWDPIHIESRLRDEFAGRPNVWIQSMKAK